MMWIEVTDTFYILYFGDGQTRPQPAMVLPGPLTLAPGSSVDNRVGSVPAGFHEPVSGFGLIWRGEVVNVPAQRPNLGWALEPEYGFQVAYQCADESSLWRCYFRDPFGVILVVFEQLGTGMWWQEW
jgi:hypothetical protein